MSLDPVQVMSGQVKELKVGPSSNGDSRGSWEEKEDQDDVGLATKPKPVTGRRTRKVEGGVFFCKYVQSSSKVVSLATEWPSPPPFHFVLTSSVMAVVVPHDRGRSHSTNQHPALMHRHVCRHADSSFTR
ncbi:hypothetical protein CesoFtcFv8_020288 [Champsocephalus esox]|uniref:Uncharacterized protein n=1 Tax=Champsocephalus esox TaxID=159716 RepID=A0AAN8BFW6_9TELE|nr:hypothetical protein CesoFtcFv8_020288 [Champsocephalus esox]